MSFTKEQLINYLIDFILIDAVYEDGDTPKAARKRVKKYLMGAKDINGINEYIKNAYASTKKYIDDASKLHQLRQLLMPDEESEKDF